ARGRGRPGRRGGGGLGAPAATACSTASVMFLTTVVRKTSQYCDALLQPSWSTQTTETLPPQHLAASAGPRAGPPATGMITSAPCETKLLAIALPLFWSVKDSANVPF